jgi:hypothetical protein
VGRGGARAGAGRHRKPLALHLLNGTYRPDRHGPLPPDGVPAAPAVPGIPLDWQPDATDLARLGAEGKVFIREALEAGEYNFIAGRLLLETADCLDLLAAYRKDIAERGIILTSKRGGTRVHPLLRESWKASRHLASLYKYLGL